MLENSSILTKLPPTGCKISTNEDLDDLPPLLLKPDGDDPFFLPEDNNGNISFDVDDEINLACPGANLTLNSTVQKFSSASAFCVSGTTFRINNSNIPFSHIGCSKHASHKARYNGKECQSEYKEFEIGFDLQSTFLIQIIGCFDPDKQTTLYTWYNLSSTIGGQQTNVERPQFIEGDFYNVGSNTVEHLYKKSSQRKTINKLLGLKANSTKYIQEKNNYYLARGHLTAKSDFVYGEQQRLTFYYVNAAPQWQTFNAANWETLESNLRSFASDRELDLIVYTGLYGITTLPHEQTGNDTQLYLYVDKNDNKALPVPHIYWKLVYEPTSKAGVVFVGINNPYHNKTEKLCSDQSKEIDWLTWKPDNQTKGFCYTCTYEDFKKVVKHLPDLEVNSLLTSSSSYVRLQPVLVLCLFLISLWYV